MKIQDILIEGIVDTDGNITLINIQTYQKYFSNLELKCSKITVVDAQKNKNNVNGKFATFVEFN